MCVCNMKTIQLKVSEILSGDKTRTYRHGDDYISRPSSWVGDKKEAFLSQKIAHSFLPPRKKYLQKRVKKSQRLAYIASILVQKILNKKIKISHLHPLRDVCVCEIQEIHPRLFQDLLHKTTDFRGDANIPRPYFVEWG